LWGDVLPRGCTAASYGRNHVDLLHQLPGRTCGEAVRNNGRKTPRAINPVLAVIHVRPRVTTTIHHIFAHDYRNGVPPGGSGIPPSGSSRGPAAGGADETALKAGLPDFQIQRAPCSPLQFQAHAGEAGKRCPLPVCRPPASRKIEPGTPSVSHTSTRPFPCRPSPEWAKVERAVASRKRLAP